MTEQDILNSQAASKRIYETIAKQLPKSLTEREELLFEVFSNHKGNTLTKLQALYDFMGDIYEFVGKYVPCKKGCSFCCYIPVSISGLEVEYIKKSENIKPSKIPIVGNFDGKPCPFLKKGTCSIYKSRPFVCRMHVILDETSKWCHPDVCNNITLSMLSFSEIKRVYESLLYESRQTKHVDIRQLYQSK